MRFVIVLVVLVVAGLMLFVRLAPTDPQRWHQPQEVRGTGDYAEAGGHRIERKITATPEEVLRRLEQRALATPRTTLVAGSVDAGRLTFRTRSLIWGFPDFTTVEVIGDTLVIYGRLRFGQSDMGVNKARVLDWLASLGPLTEPL